MRDNEFEFIRSLVYERTRIRLDSDRRDLVAARLGKRLRATRSATIGDYCRILKDPEGHKELSRLIDVISTHHTFFFRENEHFDFIRDHVVPEMLARTETEHWPALRAWSAACSSGEECYSLAITFAECLRGRNWPWHIEGSDISEGVLEQARNAIYSEEAVGRLPREISRTYFQRGVGPQTGNYRVKARLRTGVSLHHLNLLGDPLDQPPFDEPFQLILCRNVMIYFDRASQEELVNRLASHLVPGGYLLVGHSESLTAIKHSLRPVKPAVYRRPLS
jgi:chemotaxis protein methyltransferase CheR